MVSQLSIAADRVRGRVGAVLVRVTRFELVSLGWKPRVLPLDYTCASSGRRGSNPLGKPGKLASRHCGARIRRSDRNRTCPFTVPNRARHLVRHAPMVDPARVARAPFRLKGDCSAAELRIRLFVGRLGLEPRLARLRGECAALTLATESGVPPQHLDPARAEPTGFEPAPPHFVGPLGIEPRPTGFQPVAQTIYARVRVCGPRVGRVVVDLFGCQPTSRSASVRDPGLEPGTLGFRNPCTANCASPDRRNEKSHLSVAHSVDRSLDLYRWALPSLAGWPTNHEDAAGPRPWRLLAMFVVVVMGVSGL